MNFNPHPEMATEDDYNGAVDFLVKDLQALLGRSSVVCPFDSASCDHGAALTEDCEACLITMTMTWHEPLKSTRYAVFLIWTPKGWIADMMHSPEADHIQQLFGTTQLPTPYTAQATLEQVIAGLKLNPANKNADFMRGITE